MLAGQQPCARTGAERGASVLGSGFDVPPRGRPHDGRQTQSAAYGYSRGRFHLSLPAVGVTTQRQASEGGGSASPTTVPVPWPGAGARHKQGASPSLRAVLVASKPFSGC